MPFVLIRLVKLSRLEYFADFFITLPITLAVAAYSISIQFGWLWLLKFTCGLFVWTFYEYATHRFLSHGTVVLRDLHGLHHRNQKDFIAIHPAVTVLVYVMLWCLFGFQSSAIMVGFSIGYQVYSILHTLFHYGAIWSSKWFYTAKRRHVAHHQFDDVNYGITIGIWDAIFKTRF